eukprot:4603462-Amphidinium_carterae.2
MIIDIYAQYSKNEEKRQGTTLASNQPTPLLPHQNRFIVFMIQHHAKKFTKIMKDAGVPPQQINLAVGPGHFDERAAQHFTNPNIRDLSDMNVEGQSTRDSRQALREAQRAIAAEDLSSVPSGYDEDYETSTSTDYYKGDSQFEEEANQRTRKAITNKTTIRYSPELLQCEFTTSTQRQCLQEQKVKTQELRLGYNKALCPKAELLCVWQL